MKHIKKFNNGDLLDSYKKSNFVTPHLYFNHKEKTFDYMAKYIKLEYISSTQTGGQYIDLGCNLFENTDDIQIDIKFNIKGGGKDYNDSSAVNQTKPSVLIACVSESDPYYGFVVRKADIGTSGSINDNYVTMYTKWQISNSVYVTANGDANNKKKYYPTYLAGNAANMIGCEQTPTNQIYEKSLIIDNLSSCTTAQLNSMKLLNTYMFATYCDAPANIGSQYRGQMWRFSESDLYYCKIIKGGQVIRDLIPVKKASTNEVGLYDLEHNKFYTSQGDNPFVAGPII